MRLLESEGRTETEAGRRFAQQHGEKVRYVTNWGKWLFWDTQRWKLDDACQIEALAKETAEQIWSDAATCLDTEEGRRAAKDITQYAKAMSSCRGIMAMLNLAKSEPGIAVTHSQLDRHPWLLNVANGTLDLRTGELSLPDPDDLLTQMTGVWFDPEADYKVWHGFLRTTFAGDLELIAFLRRLVGYCLTGTTTEHILPILHGGGANGKSVFINTITKLLGEYAGTCQPSMLLAKRGEEHPTAFASFFGKRFVSCAETDEGRRLDEAKIKALTGGDIIQARRMREDFWEFMPTHKLWLATNHKPTVRGTDNGIWRRLRIIPFTQTFNGEARDEQLPSKLENELSGILNWALLGAREFITNGLGTTTAVDSATSEYRHDEDQIFQWLSDCCKSSPNSTLALKSLFESYSEWCAANREHPVKQKVLSRQLRARGFESYTNNGTRFKGITFKPSDVTQWN